MSTPAVESSAADPRFNAATHGFSGEFVHILPADLPRYQSILAAFHTDWFDHDETPGGTVATLIEELALAKFQGQQIRSAIRVLLIEQGAAAYSSDPYRLLNRYLREHRTDFHRALRALQQLRTTAHNLELLRYKFEIDAPIRQLQAEARKLAIALRASESSAFSGNVNTVSDLREFLGWDSLHASAAAPPCNQ